MDVGDNNVSMQVHQSWQRYTLGGSVCEGRGMWGLYILSSQFYSEPKTASKESVKKKKKPYTCLLKPPDMYSTLES